MKKLTLFVILAFCCFYCYPQYPKKTDLEIFDYKGSVKSAITNSYKAEKKFGDVVKSELNETNSEYFDKQGNLVESELKFLDSKTPITQKYKYKKGLLIETEFISSLDYSLTEKLYNNLGQLQEENVYDHSGDLYTKTKYNWSSFFKMSGYSTYNSDGKFRTPRLLIKPKLIVKN